jgi:hypothetical protein
MGDADLSGRCFRNSLILHVKCSGELFTHQKAGDRFWCACECHGERPRPGGNPNSVDRRRWDAWRAGYDRLVGTAEELPT